MRIGLFALLAAAAWLPAQIVIQPLPPNILLTPPLLQFSFAVGGALPTVQNVGVDLSFGFASFTATPSAPWIAAVASPSQTPGNVAVSVNPAGLAVGQHSGTVTVQVAGSDPAEIAVALAVTSGPGGGAGAGLHFVPVTPCRLVDTREALGSFGTPALAAGQARSFSLPQARCGLPASAKAYSLNVTVAPKGPLGYLTIWPTGVAQPFVSTLNSLDGRVKANAAIVPAGDAGAVSVFATNATELILDVNGYFLEGAALAFYPLPPCRVADTRNPAGSLGGPVLAANAARAFPVLASGCGVPANAQAYSLNATVVPSGILGHLTLWGTGQPQPFVSTLNAPTGAIVANAAIVPAGTNGSIDAFVTNQTHLVLDINGYFAPPGAANAQRFFPVTPCRLLDTRNAAGEFGGPALAAKQARSFRFPLVTGCGLPALPGAYSLNATVAPQAGLGYLTLWPTGQAQPFVSTLNAAEDPIVANAAIVPAGTAGAVSAFATEATQLVMDLNGYFAP